MKLLGPGELAIRLPSCIAVFLTCMALLFLSIRYLKNYWFGFIAVILLITSDGYVNYHIGRTGDYDALLTCFLTCACLAFFAFCETRKNKYLYFCFGALTLGVLTKGVAGLLFVPAFFLYALLRWQFKYFLKNKHFYFGILGLVVIVVGYYLLREYKSPGYLATIQQNELGGRFMSSQGNQTYNFWFYYTNFVTYRLSDRYLLVPCGLILSFFSRNERIRRLGLFTLIALLSFFLLISKSQTKLYWYDAPMYPFLALAVAFFVHFIFDLLDNSNFTNQALAKNVLPFLFLFLIFLKPYQLIWSRTFYPDEYSWDAELYECGYYLKNAIKGKIDLNGQYLLYEGYNAHNLFYTQILTEEKGVRTGILYASQKLNAGDSVIVCQESMKQKVQNNYRNRLIRKQNHIETYEILGPVVPADSLDLKK
jgi:4-amino-4-deoxy-L-arabinose transferase-like glycosyltransferase